jgi:hypothetical protein
MNWGRGNTLDATAAEVFEEVRSMVDMFADENGQMGTDLIVNDPVSRLI